MPFSLPKWISDAAVIALIFSVGAYATRIELSIKSINEDIEEIKTNKIQEMEKKIVAVETAISIHHGRDWSEKMKKNTLLKVEDLEETIGGISDKFEKRVTSLGSNFSSTVKNLSDIQKRITAVGIWTKQGDALIKINRLEQFRALTVYSIVETDNPYEIMINKQHRRGGNYKKGDSIMLINPQPPGLQVEVSVKGFLDDPKSTNVLVQINEKLLDDLGLTTIGGQYELFVQGKPEALRWKTLDEIHQEL